MKTKIEFQRNVLFTVLFGILISSCSLQKLEIVGIEIRNPIFNKQLEPIGIWKTINDKDTKEIIDLMLNKNERYAKGGYLEGYISLKPIAEIRIKTNKNRYETWNSQGNIIHIKNKYYEIDSEYIKIIDKYLKE